MLDEKDLQAIQAMLEAMELRTDKKLEAMEQRIDQKLGTMEQRIDQKLGTMEQRIMQGAAVLMDAEFSKHFRLLSEQQETALSHAATDDDLAIIEGRIDDLEAVTRTHAKEIERLKKAN